MPGDPGTYGDVCQLVSPDDTPISVDNPADAANASNACAGTPCTPVEHAAQGAQVFAPPLPYLLPFLISTKQPLTLFRWELQESAKEEQHRRLRKFQNAGGVRWCVLWGIDHTFDQNALKLREMKEVTQ